MILHKTPLIINKEGDVRGRIFQRYWMGLFSGWWMLALWRKSEWSRGRGNLKYVTKILYADKNLFPPFSTIGNITYVGFVFFLCLNSHIMPIGQHIQPCLCTEFPSRTPWVDTGVCWPSEWNNSTRLLPPGCVCLWQVVTSLWQLVLRLECDCNRDVLGLSG